MFAVSEMEPQVNGHLPKMSVHNMKKIKIKYTVK